MLWVTCFPLSAQLPRKQHREQCVKHRDKGKQCGFGRVGASFPVGFEDANSNHISMGRFLPAPGALQVWPRKRKRLRVAVTQWSCQLLDAALCYGNSCVVFIACNLFTFLLCFLLICWHRLSLSSNKAVNGISDWSFNMVSGSLTRAKGCQISNDKLIYSKHSEHYFHSYGTQMMPSKASVCWMGCRWQRIWHAVIL